MSLEVLRITGGRKLADGLAAITAVASLAAGCALSPLALLLFDPSELRGEALTYLTLTLLCALAFVLVGQLFIGLALGRPHTGGSRRRFLRYQLGALSIGAGLGCGFAPAMFEAAVPWWIIGITIGIVIIGLSLLFFLSSSRRPLNRPPHPGIALTDGIVVDHWSGRMLRDQAPQLAVVRFADTTGRARFARHLVQQRPTVLGTIGQVQFDRRRPTRVLRFIPYPPTTNNWNTRSSRDR